MPITEGVGNLTLATGELSLREGAATGQSLKTCKAVWDVQPRGGPRRPAYIIIHNFMIIRLTCSILVAWLMLLCPAWAQSDTSHIRHQEHDEVIVTGKKNPVTPSSQKVEYADISVLPVASVTDALKLMNSVNVKDYGGIGGLSTVSVRGLGASHTLVNIDGIQISNTQAGQVDISRFSFNPGQELTLRIAGASHMATAREYASPATLNITSASPAFAKDRHDYVNVALKAGSFGYFGTDAVYARRLGEESWLRAEGEYTMANGEYPFTLVNGKTVTEERRINSDVLAYKGDVSSHLSLRKTTIDLKAYAYNSDRGLPGSVVLYNRTANERLSDKNCFLQGSVRRSLSQCLEAKVYAKANYSNSLYEDTNVKYAGGKLVENSTQREMYLSEVMMLYINKVWRSLTMSIDETHSTLESTIQNCPQPTRNTVQAAADLNLDLWGTRCNLIGVYTHVREQVESGSHLGDIDKWRPAVRISRAWGSPYAPELTLSWKKTFRVPTFNELYYTTLGTTGLRPEQAQEFSLDLAWPVAAVSVYRNYVIDKIVAIPTTYVWKMANYGKVEITGVDVSVDKRLELRFCKLHANAKYAYQRAYNKNERNPKLYGGQVPYTPLHSGSGYLGVDVRWLAVGYSMIWSGKRYFAEYNIPDNEVDAYVEQSVSVSRDFRIHGAEISARISCINLADRQYDVIKYYPMPGRNWKIQLIFKL